MPKQAIYSVKHSAKKSFLAETYGDFTQSLESYVGGAFEFAQLAVRRFFADHGELPLAEGGGKKGTLIFTGTLGALRCSAEFAAYGAGMCSCLFSLSDAGVDGDVPGRSSVRQLAQSLAREMSAKGVQVVHAIANGRIADEDSEETRRGERIAAEAVGKTYLWLAGQEPTLWTHELDLRPACEKF